MELQESVSERTCDRLSELCALGKKYGTDKYPWYTPFYDGLLSGRQIKTVLEIGVLNGASLLMWHEYFPGAAIYGLDKADTGPISARVTCLLGDQSKPEDLEATAMSGPFDLIVDDGSHKPSDQVLGAITLVPHLRKGGLYIIEDVTPPAVNSFVINNLSLRFPCQYVECRVPGSDLVGRCVVIQSQ